MRAGPSPNHGERRGGLRPTLIVLHYTGMPSLAEARARLCDPVHEVSAHWLVAEGGHAEALVDEHRRAWHAGAGSWGAITDVNSASIGIEIQNPGDAPFPEPQMAGLEQLLTGIMARWDIPSQGVIAHSDMAPTRKIDPGVRFDWCRLARLGLSVWPEAGQEGVTDFAAHAHRFGYPQVEHTALINAFRLRFRPWAKGPLDTVDARRAADLAKRFPAK